MWGRDIMCEKVMKRLGLYGCWEEDRGGFRCWELGVCLWDRSVVRNRCFFWG